MLTKEFYEEELEKELARRKHLNFVQYTWDESSPYLVGYHTRIICEKIDKAIERFRVGKSSFVIVSVPYRHGKSELVSRTLPPHFLAEFPEKEVMVVTHTADRAYEFSKDARRLVRDNSKFKTLYPGIKLADGIRNVKSWRLSNEKGKSQYYGFSSGISGAGAHLLIIDDFFKNREDAESETISDKVFDEFGSGVMSRLPDPYIVIIVATRWNLNDLIARCLNEAQDNPDYPQADYVCLPGESLDYPTGYLFPEKYSPAWYKGQKATLVTQYAWSSLMQQQPILKGGNLFQVDNIQIIEEKEVPEHRQVVVIDLASSEANKNSKDPDYTVCMRGFMTYVNNQSILYITDMIRIREQATKRNKAIKKFILKYQNSVYMESFGGYKDTYTMMQDELMGIVSVSPLTLPKSKEIKAEPLESIFEAGNVNIVKKPWNSDLITEAGEFPKGKHDDIVDCMAMIYHIYKKKPRVKGRNVVY